MTFLERVLELTPMTAEASTVPSPIGRPGGPGLWKHKDLELPPYIQHVAKALMRDGHSESDAIHMAVGIVKNWARGHDGHGHHVHTDVRAAASGNVAKWEETRARAHAESAAHHTEGHDEHDDKVAASGALDAIVELAQTYAASYLPGAAPPRTLTGQTLQHAPTSTVSPSPPLPPGVSYPTPAELLELSGQIEGLDDSTIIRGAANQVRTAAVQAGNKQYPDALRMLRGAQEGVRSAHHQFNGENMPTINVYSASLNPEATAAAQKAMLDVNAQRNRYRAASTAIATHIDRIRRAHYHGMYGGLAEARFSGDDMSALDRVLRLAAGDADSVGARTAMIYLQVPRDQIPAGAQGSKPGHITVCYLGDISDAQFMAACERTRAAAKAHSPVHGSFGGLAVFPASDSSGGRAVAYVPVSIPGVHQLHAALEDLCPDDAMPFAPHMTLGYIDPMEDMTFAPATSAKVCFPQLMICRGDQVRAFAFSGHHHAHDHAGGQRRDTPNSNVPMTALGRVLALSQGR